MAELFSGKPALTGRCAWRDPRTCQLLEGQLTQRSVQSVLPDGYRTCNLKRFSPGTLIHHRTCNTTGKQTQENYLTALVINGLELETSTYRSALLH